MKHKLNNIQMFAPLIAAELTNAFYSAKTYNKQINSSKDNVEIIGDVIEMWNIIRTNLSEPPEKILQSYHDNKKL